MTALSPMEQDFQRRFNAFHAARARAPMDLVSQLYAEAMGDAYPPEVAPYSSCDWSVLGTMVGRLRLRPGQLLVDLGCGTGGVGLWLSRALSVHLIGIDISSTAVQLASARSAAFGPSERASFRVATLAATDLPSGRAHGVICMDAFGIVPDRAAAFHELRRILRPGARAILTRATRCDAGSGWTETIESAGLDIEHVDERPGEPEMWYRLYGLWIAHEAGLRRDLGDAEAESMLHETARRLPTLASRRAVVLTLRRPVDKSPSAESPGDKLPGLVITEGER